jgi:hypothetical protein
MNIQDILAEKERQQQSRLKNIIVELYDIISFLVFAL